MATHINEEQKKNYDLRSALRKIRAEVEVDDPRVIAHDAKPHWTAQDIDVRDVLVAAYQRPLVEQKVRKMVREGWKPLKGDVLKLSARRDGSTFVIDGQHRIIGLIRIGDPALYRQKAVVWHGLTMEQEAEMFAETQSSENRTAVVPEHLHNARLEGGKENALRIEAAVRDAGYQLQAGGPRRSGRIRAVKQLYEIEDRYGIEMLRVTLRTLSLAWGPEHVPEAALITGMAQFAAMFPDADMDALARRMAREPMDHWVIEADARGKVTDVGISLKSKRDRVSWRLHHVYNITHHKRPLPNFGEALRTHRSQVQSVMTIRGKAK